MGKGYIVYKGHPLVVGEALDKLTGACGVDKDPTRSPARDKEPPLWIYLMPTAVVRPSSVGSRKTSASSPCSATLLQKIVLSVVLPTKKSPGDLTTMKAKNGLETGVMLSFSAHVPRKGRKRSFTLLRGISVV
jgi:hypothetical protein